MKTQNAAGAALSKIQEDGVIRFLRERLCVRGWRWRVIFVLASTAGVILLVSFAFQTAAEREEVFKFGSSRFAVVSDPNSLQEEFFTQSHDPADPASGDFESRHEFAVRLGSGVLRLHIERDPVPVIEKRLPKGSAELARLIDSRNPAEVFCAAEALAQKEDADVSVLPKLIAAADHNGIVYHAIGRITYAAPTHAIPFLIEGLSSTNLELRGTCAVLLGEMGTNATVAVPALHAAFKASRLLHPAIAEAVFKITGDCSTTLPALRTLLINPSVDWYLKASTLNCLQLFGAKAEPAVGDILRLATISHCTNAAAPRNADLQAAAVRVLSRVSTNAAIVLPPILAALAEDPVLYPNLRAAAIGALGKLGSAGLPQLIDLYSNSTNQSERSKASRALAEIGPPAAEFLDVFQRDLISNKPDRVELACHVIARLRERAEPVVPTLTNLLHVPSRKIRIHAASTLNRLGQYSDTMVRVLVSALAEMAARPHLYFAERELALTTLTRTMETNSLARAVVEERRASHPQVIRLIGTTRVPEGCGLCVSPD